jgi:hypothetical protein
VWAAQAVCGPVGRERKDWKIRWAQGDWTITQWATLSIFT